MEEAPRGQVWLVCFQDPLTHELPWWIRQLERGWRHCYALRYEPGLKAWLLVEQLWWRLDVRLIDGKEVGQRMARSTAKVDFRALTATQPPRWSPVTCVGALKQLLGLRCWAVTPRQLHTQLMRRGAIPR
jgi:hypothetical protein